MTHFTDATRKKVVMQHIQDGRTLKSLAVEYGVSKASISNWVRAYREEFYVPRRKKPSYKKGLQHKLFPNLLNQNFVISKPNRVWCTDFTYLYLTNG